MSWSSSLKTSALTVDIKPSRFMVRARLRSAGEDPAARGGEDGYSIDAMNGSGGPRSLRNGSLSRKKVLLLGLSSGGLGGSTVSEGAAVSGGGLCRMGSGTVGGDGDGVGAGGLGWEG